MTSAHPRFSAAFEAIASDITDRIRSGEFPAGQPLPSMTELAEHYSVARGTVRRALEQVRIDERLVVRRGARWRVCEPAPPHSFSVLQSFAQWAQATGQEPAGRTVALDWGRAGRWEASELQLRAREPVLRCRRVRSLDGRPVMVEHTTYPARLGAIIEALPVDEPSVTRVLEAHDVTLAYAEHRITAIAANTSAAGLLDVETGSPLLRVRRTGYGADGQPFECSEDCYLPDIIELSVANAVRG